MADPKAPDSNPPDLDDEAGHDLASESIDDLIARYGAGAPVIDDYVDPDLARLSPRPPVLQLLLILVVVAFGGFVAWTLRLDLAYYFADDTPVDLGAAEDLAVVLDGDPDYLRQFGSNVYVRVAGVPSRRSVTGDHQFAQLVGAPIFVEGERDDPGADPILRDVRLRYGPHDGRRTRFYIETSGRLLAIEELGNRYQGLVGFYRDGYDIWFCGTERTRRQQDFRRLTGRELAEALGREPSEAELDAAFPCTYGVLVQADKAPSDNAGFLIAFFFIGLVELAGLAYVLRWGMQWARSRATTVPP